MIAVQRAQQRAFTCAVTALHHPALSSADWEIEALQHAAILEMDIGTFASNEDRAFFVFDSLGTLPAASQLRGRRSRASMGPARSKRPSPISARCVAERGISSPRCVESAQDPGCRSRKRKVLRRCDSSSPTSNSSSRHHEGCVASSRASNTSRRSPKDSCKKRRSASRDRPTATSPASACAVCRGRNGPCGISLRVKPVPTTCRAEKVQPCRSWRSWRSGPR